MENAAAIIFWCCVLTILYEYLVYPPVIFACSRLFGRRGTPAELDRESLPRISLLIAAYNEEDVIQERIENALRLDYPRDKLEIVVASDGSTDATSEIVRRYADRGVVLLDFPQRRGKSMVINDAMTTIGSDIVLLSDANTDMEPGAARRLVRWFHDPSIAAVCGRLKLFDSKSGSNVDSHYWRYENFLKRCEGRLDAALGANGAIYAIRREAFRPIPRDTLVDDLTIPLYAKLHGCGCIVYDSQAVAVEETAPNLRSEFRRRSRIGAGGFQAIARLWQILHPRYGWTAFSFLSHKVLRWCSPFLLAGAILSSSVLVDIPMYRVLWMAQLLFYAAAALGSCLTPRGHITRSIRLVAFFTGVNFALFAGFIRWLQGNQNGVWLRTPRTA
jgi:cellulose synthase/poly-beta-1,6-N-acetylglucosamine synthase-like glycosyltransferase